MRANTDYLSIRLEFSKNWNGRPCTKGYIKYKQLEIGYTWYNPNNGTHYVNWYDAQGNIEQVRAASSYDALIDTVMLMTDDVYNRIAKALEADADIVPIAEQKQAEFGRYAEDAGIHFDAEQTAREKSAYEERAWK